MNSLYGSLRARGAVFKVRGREAAPLLLKWEEINSKKVKCNFPPKPGAESILFNTVTTHQAFSLKLVSKGSV